MPTKEMKTDMEKQRRVSRTKKEADRKSET